MFLLGPSRLSASASPFLVSSISVVFCSLVLAAYASGCIVGPRPDVENFDASKEVFRALVTEVRLVRPPNSNAASSVQPYVMARYEIKEVLKGTPHKSGIVRDGVAGAGSCSLGLLPGLEYVFFPDNDRMVLYTGGSFLVSRMEAEKRIVALREFAALPRKK